MNASDLSQIDYNHWCKQVGQKNISVFKDTIVYRDYRNNCDVEIKKCDLEESPIEVSVDKQ